MHTVLPANYGATACPRCFPLSTLTCPDTGQGRSLVLVVLQEALHLSLGACWQAPFPTYRHTVEDNFDILILHSYALQLACKLLHGERVKLIYNHSAFECQKSL